MPKVLLITPRANVAEIFAHRAPAGFALDWQPNSLPEEQLAAHIRDAEYVVLHPAAIKNSLLATAESLRHIQLLTAGHDRIDLAETARRGITVSTNGGANSWAVAEHTVALLLALYKKLLACDRSVRAGTWRQAVNGFDTFEVAGKTVGLLGAGQIGRKVAERLKSFETEIVYYDPSPNPSLETAVGARLVDSDTLFATADIITLHLPLTPQTRGMIGPREFALMKQNAVVLNASRGEIIDEDALVAALSSGKLLGAGLDVFHHEPIEPGHPLLKLDNVVLTPHTAGHAFEGWFRRTDFAWKNIRRIASGEDALSTVR